MFRHYWFTLILIAGFSFSSLAQSKMISLATSYNVPLGKMAWSYKSAPGVLLSGWVIKDFKHWTTGAGIGLGYTQFNPIADTLYYVVDRGGVGGIGLGKAVYSPFQIIKLSAYLMAIRSLNKKIGVEFGMEVGYYYGKRDISFTDEFGGSDGVSELVTRGALVPKLGLEYRLNNHISLVPFVAYTLIIEVGDTNPNAMNYNPDTGMILHYYSAGLSLNFLF